MPRLDIIRFSTDDTYRKYIQDLVTVYGMLGFCVFGGTKEIVKATLSALQELRSKDSERKLLFSIDAEWGAAMRITDGSEYPHAFALAKTRDPLIVEEVGYAIGVELRDVGIDWSFAPVADINSNPKNPIINIRSFGDTPEEVVKYSVCFQNGLHKAGLLTSPKHFPGHGDTYIDSHQGLPYIDRSLEEFLQNELLPFESLIAAITPSIMLGHLAAPKLSAELGTDKKESSLPATISPAIATNLLRERMKYNGVVISDSLEMAGIRSIGYSDSEIALRALRAGVDILLMPPDPIETYHTLETIEYEYSDARIDTLFGNRVFGHLHVRDGIQIESARKAIHIEGVLNIIDADYHIIYKDNEQDIKKAQMLREKVSAITDTPSQSTFIIILDRPRGQLVEEKKGGGVIAQIREVVDTYIKKNISPRGIILLGNPYLEEYFSPIQPQCVIQTYSDSLPSLYAILELFNNK